MKTPILFRSGRFWEQRSAGKAKNCQWEEAAPLNFHCWRGGEVAAEASGFCEA